MSSLFSLPAAAAAILAFTPASACQSRNDAMPVSDPASAASAAIGLWDIRPVDAAAPGLCRLALRGDVSADGHLVVIETCDLKAASRTRHWRTSPNGFSLVDAAGAPVITFTADSVDSWTGVDADGQNYRMTRTAMF